MSTFVLFYVVVVVVVLIYMGFKSVVSPTPSPLTPLLGQTLPYATVKTDGDTNSGGLSKATFFTVSDPSKSLFNP